MAAAAAPPERPVRIQIDEYKLSVAEYRQGVRLYYRAGIQGWSNKLLVLVLCFLMFLAAWRQAESLATLLAVVVVGVMAVAAALVRFVLFPLLLPYWLHQRARGFGRLQLVIDDSGIAEKSGLGESLI